MCAFIVLMFVFVHICLKEVLNLNETTNLNKGFIVIIINNNNTTDNNNNNNDHVQDRIQLI